MLYTFYIKTTAMKKIVLALLLSLPFAGYSQNYQCLQAGVKHYFLNSNSYLRGIRIDSVTTSGSITNYFPFHTPRGTYITTLGGSNVLDSAGGSWLGKKVMQLSDGTFLFDNLWHDTVVIKTLANVGDNWVFWRDTIGYYYDAQLTGMDTMTILGSLDSVKTINITAFDTSGSVPADHMNNFKIILSKNNGFVQVFDLYTFPYQPNPYNTFFPFGYDYFFDRVISGTGGPSAANSVFSLTTLINPTYKQLYNWNTGDVFENSTCLPSVNSTGLYPYRFYVDTITNKTVLPAGIQYNYKGWVATQVIDSWPPGTSVLDYNYPYATLPDSGSFTVTDSVLLDTTYMPEEYKQNLFIYYLPNDTTWCMAGARYTLWPDYFHHDTLEVPIEGHYYRSYKIGPGLLHYSQGAPELAVPYLTDTSLLYIYKSGTGCGAYTIPGPPFTSVPGLIISNSFSIFPNPATEELTIKTTLTQPYTITLQNMLGEAVQTLRTASQQQTINLVALPAGVYSVIFTDDVGSRYNEKIVVIPRL